MIYMCADNDLGFYADSLDLAEIDSAIYSPYVTVLIYHDDIEMNGSWIYVSTQGPDGTIELDTIMTLPEANMGDPGTLASFIEFGVTEFPAKHYAVILWDHGGGWMHLPINLPPDFRGGLGTVENIINLRETIELMLSGRSVKQNFIRGLCYDWTDNDYLTMQDLETAFKLVYSDTGIILDIVGFDACLMQMLEVQYQIKEYAYIMVASQEVEPTYGWPYESILNALASQPLVTPTGFAKIIIDSYAEFYDTWSYYTMSAVDLTKIDMLSAELDNLAKELMNNNRYILGMHKARMSTATFWYPYFMDLYDFIEQLTTYISDGELADLADSIMKIIEEAVIYERHGQLAGGIMMQFPGIDVAAHENAVHGISIYHPYSSATYRLINFYLTELVDENYTILKFSHETMWDEFLETMLPAIEVMSMEGFTTIIECYGFTPYCYTFELSVSWDGQRIPVIAQTHSSLFSYVTDQYGRARLILATPNISKVGLHEVRVSSEWLTFKGITYVESLPTYFKVAEFALPKDIKNLIQTIEEVNHTLNRMIQEVNQTINIISQKLMGEIESLEEKLSSSIETINSEIISIKLWIDEKFGVLEKNVTKLNETINILSIKLDEAYEELRGNINTLNNRLRMEIDSIRSDLDSAITQLRKTIDTFKKDTHNNITILYGASSIGIIIAVIALTTTLKLKK